MGKKLELTSPKKYTGELYKHMKRYLSLVTREMKIKSTVSYHYISTIMAI